METTGVGRRVEAGAGHVLLACEVGFAFLLAMFPFYTWIPLIAEEAHPLTVGLLLWLFPTASREQLRQLEQAVEVINDVSLGFPPLNLRLARR